MPVYEVIAPRYPVGYYPYSYGYDGYYPYYNPYSYSYYNPYAYSYYNPYYEYAYYNPYVYAYYSPYEFVYPGFFGSFGFGAGTTGTSGAGMTGQH